MTLSIQVVKFKFHHYPLKAISPNFNVRQSYPLYCMLCILILGGQLSDKEISSTLPHQLLSWRHNYGVIMWFRMYVVWIHDWYYYYLSWLKTLTSMVVTDDDTWYSVLDCHGGMTLWRWMYIPQLCWYSSSMKEPSFKCLLSSSSFSIHSQPSSFDWQYFVLWPHV